MRSAVQVLERQCLLFGIGVAFLAGCDAKGTEAAPDEGCVSNEKFFAAEVWGPTLSTDCFQCHNAQGAANQTKFVLRGEAETGFLDANIKIVQDVAAFEVDGTSIILLKPTMEIAHEGGMRLDRSSAGYQALAEMVQRFDAPVACADAPDETFFEGVVMADDVGLLRKVSLNLVGRLPTQEEEQAIVSGGAPALESVLDQMLTEDAFYARLKEIYNDQFLTDRYLRNRDGLDLLDSSDYPMRNFYDNDADENRRSDLANLSNYGVAREPLELISHVVKNDRPFTEILTADYIMVNAFSARSYGVTQAAYVDGTDVSFYDPNLFFEGQVSAVPHAGVLTSHVFLNRFPTTATNVNRHRSRMVFQFFLATDVLKLAERPVDPTQIQDHNPTLNNSGCNVCHAVMDPVAGAFQNWDDRGRYRIPEMGWHEHMRPPGFGDETIPNNETSLQWLASKIAGDDRFATAAIHTMYRALTGEEPLRSSTSTLRAFEAQEDLFKQIRAEFVASGYSFKTMVKAIALSPYMRAVDLRGARDTSDLPHVGSAHLLTPEQLDRKIEAVLGYPWERNGRRQLLSTNEMRIFYGGIDSNSITKRITEPNGVMASIATRMANEMSCLATPMDFTFDAADRRLFPHVEMTYAPEDDNGFEIPGGVEKIKTNIRHLHAHILGEAVSSVELDRTYQLFLETWREGKAGIAADEIDIDSWNCRAERDPITGEDLPEERRVRRDEDYTLRAWMAVVTYLLSDYDFLYE